MVTLGSFDDYHVVWNIVGKGSVAIDDIDLREVVREVSLIGETFEESKIVQGLLPFELAETLESPSSISREVKRSTTSMETALRKQF